jgi:hypothetical protein
VLLQKISRNKQVTVDNTEDRVKRTATGPTAEKRNMTRLAAISASVGCMKYGKGNRKVVDEDTTSSYNHVMCWL